MWLWMSCSWVRACHLQWQSGARSKGVRWQEFRWSFFRDGRCQLLTEDIAQAVRSLFELRSKNYKAGQLPCLRTATACSLSLLLARFRTCSVSQFPLVKCLSSSTLRRQPSKSSLTMGWDYRLNCANQARVLQLRVSLEEGSRLRRPSLENLKEGWQWERRWRKQGSEEGWTGGRSQVSS